MTIRRQFLVLWCLLGWLNLKHAGAAPPHSTPPSPHPQKTLAATLKITWTRGPNLPQGFQDSDGGIIGNELITVGGFSSGGLAEDNRRKPGRYPRGFLKKGWAVDLSAQDKGWRALPDFPGAARQGLCAARVGEALYFWGGFSYDEPYCYADGWKLAKANERWTWTPLPPLPWPMTSCAMSTLGTKIFCFGGADYDAKAFYTDTDRHGNTTRLGARLLELDTADPKAAWRELPACPGSPRFVHTMGAVSGKLFVLGGATGDVKRDGKSYGYCTVVDNWLFDPAASKWSRLRDLAISSGNFARSTACVFKDRYILLPGGHQYTYVRNPDGTIRDKYGAATSKNPKSGLYNNVFVYDTASNLFGAADPLPIDNNLPMTVVRGDHIYLLGGETGGGVVDGEYYGHHPDLFLIGRIEEVGRTGGTP